MLFTSIEFIIFLSITIGLYFIFPLNKRWIILLIASCIFYCIAGIKFIPFIGVTSLITYFAALCIDRKHCELDKKLEEEGCEKQQEDLLKEKCESSCKKILVIAILIALGLLSYTKFTNMIIDSLQKLLNGFGIQSIQLSPVSIIVPLGISYYTFSTIGYVVDVYWREYRAEKNFFKYLLFVMYFPHILQGPFARYNRLAHQLIEGHKFDYQRACFGIQLMLWGYFKKLVIADRLAVFVGSVYGDWRNQAGFIIIIATFFSSIQLYTDFSGCVDISRGMSQIMGIELDRNFCQPYFSRSIDEYWRRWHISLGEWFRDYLYMPVSVSRFVKKCVRKVKDRYGKGAAKNIGIIIPLSAVWLVTGIWHGSGWGYIIWGIWQGGLIISSILLKKKFTFLRQKLHIDEKKNEWKLFQTIRTFMLASFIPKVFTLTDSLPSAFGLLGRIFSQFNIWVFFDQSLYQYGLDRQDFELAIVAIIVLFVVSVLKEKGIQIRESIAKKNIILRWTIYYVAIFSIIIFGMYGPGYEASNFVYMKF